MPAQILDGRAIAKSIRTSVKEQIEAGNLSPGLAAILVGDDPASHIYVRLKERAAARAGIRFERFRLSVNAEQDELEQLIQDLNKREDIHAILLQLPLPGHMDEDAAIRAIRPEKDVDGFHPENIQCYLRGEEAVEPVLTRAVVELIRASEEDLTGKHAAIIANNPAVFAPPILKALDTWQVTTDWMKRDVEDLQERVKDADIVIVALGSAFWLKPELVKPGALLIDIGTNKVDDQVVGDVDPAVDSIAGWRSPVPGGVGPVTVACLLQNVLVCQQRCH